MGKWAGSCHCGAVRFTVEAEPFEVSRCDCSLCRRKGAMMTQVPHAALTLEAGEEHLSLYQWNTGVARHYFCRHCGIYTFHSKRSAPGNYGVNVGCLEGFDPSAYPFRQADGAEMTVQGEGRPEWHGPRED